MAGPPAPTTSSSSPGQRRSALLGPGRDHRPPTPPPPAAASPPEEPGPRRSIRIRTRTRARVHGLPSAALSSSRRRRTGPPRPTLQACAEEWAKGKAASGAPEEECVLPFLQKGAPRKVECLICSKSIMPDERMQCSSNHCDVTLHKVCSEQYDGRCPRHVCFYCKRGASFHRMKHLMPACTQCLLQTNRMVESVDLSETMISWSIWPSTSEGVGLADDIEEAFRRLPLPYTDREFNIDPIKTEELESFTKPPIYVRLKHNVYSVKHKCDGDAIEGGCTDCEPPLTCQNKCSCRSLWISCTRACKCSNKCTNRPFRREKRIEVVKTQHCGWGVKALESIEKGDFVIEFVGEVIDGVTCDERLEDMKQRGDPNFYMCKVNNNFVIDATFRGNACRFLNHSCEPNCQLEKWQVNGRTRLGVFASEAIKVGDPLTYSYRFKQHFGPRMECLCGAANCQGKL